MLQPARVLPSNAPPLQEGGDGLHQASRVLQEHSGNRQQHYDFGSTGDWDQTKYAYDQQKYAANVWTGENAYARHHVPHHQHQPFYHHPQLHRPAYRYPYPRGPFVNEAKIQYDAERLFQRFERSEQYLKYRSRQSKEDKGNGDQKWPDHLEKAFFRALITYPPMGRRKQLHKEKQRGRNELIADCIEELTGEARSRKQVSSHIQVLKPFVEHDKQIMKWLSKEDMRANTARCHGHPYPTGRRLSNYPVTAPPQLLRSGMPSLPKMDAHGIQQLKQSPQAFEPTDFQMFIQRKYKDAGKEERTDRVHVYSQAVNNPLADDHHMPDWQTLARDFPQLAEANAQRPLDCTVLIAEASLAFPTESMEKLKNHEDASIELGIYFLARSHLLPAPQPGMSKVFLRNKFYSNGEEATQYSDTTPVDFHPVTDTVGGSSAVVMETEIIKFGSKFWAKQLGQVGLKLRDESSQQKEEMPEYVRSLSALQEVFVETDRGQHERIAVVHWNFRLSGGACGRASWKRLILPQDSSTTGVYTAPTLASSQQHRDQEYLKTERADSFYDYATSLAELTHSNSQQQQPLPALQSPFEYDASNGSHSHSDPNSALSSATWPTSLSDAGPADFGADTSFDFNPTGATDMTMHYDPTLNFDAFDSSAFNFDDPAAAGVDFAADPALQDFGTGAGWYDGFDNSTQHGLGVGLPAAAENGSFATQPDFDGGNGDVGSAEMYGGYDGSQYDDGSFQTAPQQQSQQDQQQAFGGAGQEVIKEEDALAALADASAWARGIEEAK